MTSPGRDGRTWDPSRLVARIRGQASHGMHTWSQVAMGVHGYSGGILLIHGPRKHTDVFKIDASEGGVGTLRPLSRRPIPGFRVLPISLLSIAFRKFLFH